MATLVLSAAGAAIGSGIGGSFLGLSSMVIGRAVGATIGRAIDNRLMGRGAEAVETGKIDRFRLGATGEGGAVAQVFGQMRVPGQMIWSSDFLETAEVTGGSSQGGKGTRRAVEPTVTTYRYEVSVAFALCEGPVLRVGRVWADGEEIAPGSLAMRVYKGSASQQPDPKMEAVEGTGQVPAYRGIAYVVIEDLQLGRFGNRIPQFSFEVLRPAEGVGDGVGIGVHSGTRGVALMPGTGEYALAASRLHYNKALGSPVAINVNSASGKSDFVTAMAALNEELPNCGSVSLVVSWFGDDLRCGSCQIRPKTEPGAADAVQMPWSVSGLNRGTAQSVAEVDGRAIYGGTPSDQSVVEAIQHIHALGKEVVFYPFLLMEILADNGLGDPWSDVADQPVLPWRGRITLDQAPGRDGSADQSAAAAADVATFFGNAAGGDFPAGSNTVGYGGPVEWSYRRFILHYARLCALAGGVSAFCIGSEMRALTQIRGAGNSFPAVDALVSLAAEVRAILGPDTRIGYAADWSEYFGYHPDDGSDDVFFHLDRLWGDTNIDFVGIDNYMPLSDWRDGEDHADSAWGDIHNIDYLKANIEGGEGYDWFYPTAAARDLQLRQPIEDGDHGEHWVYRYKDIRSWWSLPHHNRVGGVRSLTATDWNPRSKPIWFTEIGCAAIDKGTNQPNKFLDPKSSESSLPIYSNGVRDELIQNTYLRALFEYWGDPAHNPWSELYEGTMLDMARTHVWAWDARPYPQFPASRDRWSDGENYARGHWLTGRVSAQPLAAVVGELCRDAGVGDVDTRALFGMVRGYLRKDVESARATLQPLMLAHAFDAYEDQGRVVFRSRRGRADDTVLQDDLAMAEDGAAGLKIMRLADAETVGRVRLNFVEADGDFASRTVETALSDDPRYALSHSEFAMSMTEGEARAVTERWLAEARIARDTLRLVLPPSRGDVAPGTVLDVALDDHDGRYRVDRVTDTGGLTVEAVRVEPGIYRPSDTPDRVPMLASPAPALPVHVRFLDLPLLQGSEVAHAPYVAATADPWPGSVAIYSSAGAEGFELNTTLSGAAVIGVTDGDLAAARAGVWDWSGRLRVRVAGGAPSGALSGAGPGAVLNGANVAAIGNGSDGLWEVLQFRQATLVAENLFELSGLLRGQAGTEAIMPAIWTAGSDFVLLNGAVQQIELPLSARGLSRNYRIGPASHPVDDPSYLAESHAFEGVGLRPYAPCQLRSRLLENGDLALSWIRRTRIDGDNWSSFEVPLGEERELYQLDILRNDIPVRSLTLSTPTHLYTITDQAADGLGGTRRFQVAQISDRFGAGPKSGALIDD